MYHQKVFFSTWSGILIVLTEKNRYITNNMEKEEKNVFFPFMVFTIIIITDIILKKGILSMKNSRAFQSLVVAFLILTSPTGMLHAFTDQATTQRILGENKGYIEFLNVCISNFASQKYSEFEDVYRIHFNGDIAFLQSDYKRAYKKVYESQGKMMKLYDTVLKDLYLEDSKNILDKIAPGIIKSKNARARLYLTLGYRDRTVSMTFYTIGEASNPKLFSYKIFKYEEGIKMARRAKRYGFLALFQSRKPEIKMKIYNQLLKKESEKGLKFFNRFLGKEGEPFIKELGLTFEENQKREQAGGKKQAFEKKVMKRVRFRLESRTARFLINHEFDRAEDLIRKYISDFNYKLIEATFDVLKADKAGTLAPNLDFEKMKVHLLDNYQRLSKESALDTFVDRLKVEDDMDGHREEDETTDKDKVKPVEGDKKKPDNPNSKDK